MKIDLHTHTTASDGSDTPTELIRRAFGLGVVALAVTDHDTVSGLCEAEQEAARLGVVFIPGIEFTSESDRGEVHLLGYHLDASHPGLRDLVASIKQARLARAREMVENLQRQGIALAWETVVETASADGFVGRGNIFRAIKAQGLVPPERAGAFFRDYLSDRGLAYVGHAYLSPVEAIAAIRAAGGVCVLAHPGRLAAGIDLELLLKELVAAGLGGLEAYYPAHDQGDTMRYLQLAQAYGLIPTGGTDYHGRFGNRVPELGSYPPPAESLARLAAVAANGRGACLPLGGR